LDSRGSSKHVDFVSALVFMGLSIYVIASGRNYYQLIQVRGDIPFYQSPGFFPVLVGVPMLICSIMLLARSLKKSGLGENLQNIKEAAIALVKSPVIHKAIVGSVWMGLYIFVLLQSLGFVAASLLFLVVIMTLLQFEKLRGSTKKGVVLLFAKYIGVSVCSVGFTYVLFQIIFRVPLP